MKTLKLILSFAFILAISGFAFAGQKDVNPQEVSSNVKKELTKIVKYPAAASEENIEGSVELIFSVDANGKLIILQSNSESVVLKNYVNNTLANLDITHLQLDPSTTYKIVFTFKLLK